MTNEQIFINRATQTPPQPPTSRKQPTTAPHKSTAPAHTLQARKPPLDSQVSKVSHSKATIKIPSHQPGSLVAPHLTQHEHFGPHNHDHWLCQNCCSGPDCRRSFNKNRKKRNRFQPNRNHKPNSPKAL